MAKVTLATVKSFINKNRSRLLINQTSRFDGMTDCVQATPGGFSQAQDADIAHTNNFGIRGVWFVFGSRDYFSPFQDGNISGFRVSNCCGSFKVGVAS